MTQLTTDNAAEILQPVFDDVLGQVKGLLTPIAAKADEAIALAKKASEEPAKPADPETPDIDITDPEAVEKHLRTLKSAKAMDGLDMTDPADVEKYLERIGHKRQEGESPEAAEMTNLQAAKAKAEQDLAKAQDALAQAEARSNQGVYSVASKGGEGTQDQAVALGASIASYINGQGEEK